MKVKNIILFYLEIENKESDLNDRKTKSKKEKADLNLPDLNIDPINLRLLLSGDIDDEIKLEKKQLKFTKIVGEDIIGTIDGKKKN